MAVRADQLRVGGARRVTAGGRGWLDRESVLGPVFVSPALILLVLLVAYPFVMALYFAMSNSFIGRPSEFIGFRNFIRLWDSDAFRQTFQNAFVFTSIAVAFKVVLGIILALLLNEQLLFQRVIRGRGLRPVLAVVGLFATIFTFSDFNIVYVLTHGGPINSTHLFATLSRMLVIDVGRLGEGAAVSLYLFPLLVFVVWAQLRFVRKHAN